MEALGGLLALFAILLVYFMPTIIAVRRENDNAGGVFVLNLFLGWTFWVGLFLWPWLLAVEGNTMKQANGYFFFRESMQGSPHLLT